MAGEMTRREPREKSKALRASIPKLNGFHAPQRDHPKRAMPPRPPKKR